MVRSIIHIEGVSKTCNVCKEVKPLQDYYPNKVCKYGVVGTCKLCSMVKVSAWYLANQKRRQKLANDRNKGRKIEVIKAFGDKCLDCKQSYPPYVYQFHHLDPTKKDVNPSYAIQRNPTTMWKELEKCVMLCANCHMIRHHGKEGVDDGSIN